MKSHEINRSVRLSHISAITPKCKTFEHLILMQMAQLDIRESELHNMKLDLRLSYEAEDK